MTVKLAEKKAIEDCRARSTRNGHCNVVYVDDSKQNQKNKK